MMERLIAIVLSGIVLVAAPVRADEETDRLASEAAALFRVVLAAEAPPKRCGFGAGWLTEAVPEYIARKFLGLTLHADLSAPSNFGGVEDVLDPQKKLASAFCDANEMAAYEKAQFEAFAKDKSAEKVRVESTDFAFPVFDADYQKAIVVIHRSGIDRERLTGKIGGMKPGDIMRHPADGADFANVFVKAPEGWKLVASELIGQS